jgi:DNA repair exonuclease SbcCD ATPase subunit
MLKSNKQKLESLGEHVDDLRGYIEACGRDIAAFKREVRQDILDLQYNRADINNIKAQIHDLAEKHNEAVEAGGVAVEQLKFDISNLTDRYRQLDKWDDETRDKFTALMNYFEISFTDGRRVVERESED